MTLKRDTITAASRVMLPTYTILAATIGLVYLFDPLDRLDSSHALTYPRAVMGGSMVPWGFVFLGLAVLMLVAFTRGSRLTFAFALSCCAGVFLGWGLMYLVSVVTDPQTSLLAPAYPWFVTTACIASTMSLLNGER